MSSPVNLTRAKLFTAVEEGAILHVDRKKKEARLDHQHGSHELVPYREAARWVDHLDQMAAQAQTGSDATTAACPPPSTELSRVVVTDLHGNTEPLCDRHTQL